MYLIYHKSVVTHMQLENNPEILKTASLKDELNGSSRSVYPDGFFHMTDS